MTMMILLFPTIGLNNLYSNLTIEEDVLLRFSFKGMLLMHDDYNNNDDYYYDDDDDDDDDEGGK